MPAELDPNLYTIRSYEFANVLFEATTDDDDHIIGDHPRFEELQTWLVQKNGDGTYHIQSGSSARFLSVDGEPKHGATLTGSGSPWKWIIEQSSGTGFWRIRVPGTQYSVELPDGKPSTKCRLVDGGRQTWIFD